MAQNPRRPSTKRFDRAPQANIQRSTFDLSHPYKTTFDSGLLIPVHLQEIIPGDSFKTQMHALTRLATPLHPTMDNLYLESFFFFVPNRLIWDNWQKFMGEQTNPGDSTDFTLPGIVRSDANESGLGSHWDYLGLPLDMIPNNLPVQALPFRAIALIYNEWFRDENLQPSLFVPTGDGPDTLSSTPGPTSIRAQPLRRGKRKDYISSSLPWPQKGPGVDLPLGTRADVKGIGTTSGSWTAGPKVGIRETGETATTSFGPHQDINAGATWFTEGTATTDGYPDIYADLTTATAATINDLRQAFQIQKLQERDARGGTRYTEIIKSHFQVVSPDSRLQRPEYLGGGHSPIQMQTVPQTSSTDATTPQGNLSAYGTSTLSGHGYTKSFVEHGYVLGFVSVRADLNYQERADKLWTRSTKYDFYWPALQAIGEQAVLNKEVWADGTAADNDVWGYQERWSELRTQLGKITGLFRSKAASTLDPWHYGLHFATRPALNNVFIEDNPPVKRTIAVQSEPDFLFDAWFDVKAARPMPVYSVPGYIDHF